MGSNNFDVFARILILNLNIVDKQTVFSHHQKNGFDGFNIVVSICFLRFLVSALSVARISVYVF